MWPDRFEPIEGTGPLAYVTNNGEDTISVLELEPLREIARRPVGMVPVDPEAPHHLTIDPVAGHVWVGLSNVGLVEGGGLHGAHGTGSLPSYVQRLALVDLRPELDVRVDSNLGEIVQTGDGRVLTTHFDLLRALDVATRGAPAEEGWGALVALDADSMERLDRVPLCTAPHGMAVTSDGALGVVACYGDDAVAIVDLGTEPPSVLARVPVGPDPGTITALRHGPYAVSIAGDDTFAYVGCIEGTSVRAIDLRTRTELSARAILADGAAFFGSFDASGARYWVATQNRDTVTQVDTATSTITARQRFAGGECVTPHEAVYVASLDRVLVVCEGDHTASGRVVALAPDTLEIVGMVDVGIYPDALRVVEPRP